MIDRSHELSIAKQAKALGISRGSIYYLPRPMSAADLAVMRRMDELHLDFPFAGSRMLRDLLQAEGIKIGRRHVSTLMKRMGIEATSTGTQGLPVSLKQDAGPPAKSSLGDGYNLHPDGAWLRLSRRRGRLVQP